ncbi:MAG: hypothetical protein ACREBH_01885 [Candidatus Micrarchaeaceae archaeon]
MEMDKNKTGTGNMRAILRKTESKTMKLIRKFEGIADSGRIEQGMGVLVGFSGLGILGSGALHMMNNHNLAGGGLQVAVGLAILGCGAYIFKSISNEIKNSNGKDGYTIK